jgi:rhamnosyltransferase
MHPSAHPNLILPSAKVAAIIVTYHPRSTVQDLVRSLVVSADRIIVVDNTPGPSIPLDQLEAEGMDCLQVMRLGQNTGIAQALNIGLEHATDCAFVLTLDQDSRLPENYISQMLNFFGTDHDDPPLAMVVPNFLDVNSGTHATFNLLEAFSLRSFSCQPGSGSHRTTLAITSGAMVARHVFDVLGGFDEALFIDQVDTEFCLRLQQCGYRALVNADITIEHAIGNRSKHRFLGLTFKPNNHGPLRRYYISRNSVAVALRYARAFPSFMVLNALRMIHEVGCIVLYENNKRAKLSAVTMGLWDGLRGRLGKWARVAH